VSLTEKVGVMVGLTEKVGVMVMVPKTTATEGWTAT
jgi:hypothetical protein